MSMLPLPTIDEPDRNCNACPRLAALRDEHRCRYPNFFNAPVPSFGPLETKLLIVGLAPGLKGANRTGRPFTGDFAGDLLYSTLSNHGFSIGTYGRESDDDLTLVDCRITNAVRCVPPGNKPLGAEVKACRPFLAAEMVAMPNLRIVLALGVIAHGAVLAARGISPTAHKFSHGSIHEIEPGLCLADSYHCSRYNTNTGRLTPIMFHQVVASLRIRLSQLNPPHA